MKTTLKGEESMQDGTIGAAHVEDVGLKIFNHADQQDRSGKFNKFVLSPSLPRICTLFSTVV